MHETAAAAKTVASLKLGRSIVRCHAQRGVLSAEFVCTYRNETFPGTQLMKRFDQESRAPGRPRRVAKVTPTVSPSNSEQHGNFWLRHFEDLYGWRGCNKHNPGVFLLSPWEFVQRWDIKHLPDPSDSRKLSVWKDPEAQTEYEPNVEKESNVILFFPDIPGDFQLRDKFFLQKRKAPIAPAALNAPLPHKQKTKEQRCKVLSLYFRPWTLDHAEATDDVVHITQLNVRKRETADACTQRMHRRRVRGKQNAPDGYGLPARSFRDAWTEYIRGNIVTKTAAQIIKQVMLTCCGTEPAGDEEDDEEQVNATKVAPDENRLPLERIHAVLDRQSESTGNKKAARLQEKDCEEDVDATALRQSTAINSAMQLTAKLWSRTATTWDDTEVDISRTSLGEFPSNSKPRSKRKKRTQKQDKFHNFQCKAHMDWDEAKVAVWLSTLQGGDEKPTVEQIQLLERIIGRCRQEAADFRRAAEAVAEPARKRRKAPQPPTEAGAFSEPVRDCLLGMPGAGKSYCLTLLRRFFEEVLAWEDGVQFQFLASQNTMAALIRGKTIHSWGRVPVNASDAQSKAQVKGADDEIDELFLQCQSMRWILIDEVSTVSPALLSLLDSFLRRACERHLHARNGRRRVPFGGLNVLFAGDFWQLPPVKNHAIFSNPFLKDT